MAMLGLGLIITRYNGTGTCLSVPVRASEYWCRSIFDRLLYILKIKSGKKKSVKVDLGIESPTLYSRKNAHHACMHVNTTHTGILSTV